MRILFCTGTAERYMAPPRLSDEQVNCGPDWHDRDIGGHFLSLGTPLGDYDLPTIAARLPGDQQPDVVVCLVDAARRSMPRNLRGFRCPKILVVADTHHMEAPLTSVIKYAQSEPFDRVVLIYDRHHWEFFAAAGLRNLHWFPGFTFPYGEDVVAAARAAKRESRIAFVGSIGICHPRRIQLLTQLNAHALPLVVSGAPQREGFAYYGASLVGFNASLNGDLNLRVFEILASGAALLTDELAPLSGLTDLCQPGRELLTYATSAQMVERARHAVAHPEETRAIGDAGARRFDALFSEAVRRKGFEALVADGIDRPEFALPRPPAVVAKRPSGSSSAGLLAAYEYAQELHRNQDRVSIVVDETVPEEFIRMCETLPRFSLRRGLPEKGERVDFLVVGRKNFGAPCLVAATHVWFWVGCVSVRVALIRRCSSMGFALIDAARFIFSRRANNAASDKGAVALVRLEKGDYQSALQMAKEELAKNPKSVDALLALAEIAQETGKNDLAHTMLGKLATLAPHHPRRQEILAASAETIRQRRPQRLLRLARTLVEQRKLDEALEVATEALALDPKSGEAHYLMGRVAAQSNDFGPAIKHLHTATYHAPNSSEYWREVGYVLRRHGRIADALIALMMAAGLAPEEFELQLALGEAALAAGHAPIADNALGTAQRLRPGCAVVQRWLDQARQLASDSDMGRPRDLLISHIEVNQRQGTGVLLKRIFSDNDDFITVRSRTLYRGEVEFGGVHFSADLPGLKEDARRCLIESLLAPYNIRRIVCVPFYAEDFEHALCAKRLTGAPLCTYVMDDRTIYSPHVPRELAGRLFAASDLRLAISAEMAAVYQENFHCAFGTLPPVLDDATVACPNHWNSVGTPATRAAMLGNVWTNQRFQDLRKFVRSTGLTVDWFGSGPNASWLAVDETALEKDGVHCRGFLPEPDLVARLATYPFVVIPSGMLDAADDNEAFSRLSLPSRLLFVLVKTGTPILVLGSPETAAGRFVLRHGIGLCTSYDPVEARQQMQRLTDAATRPQLLENARRLAPCFVMPNAGEWIWRSLRAGRPESTLFDGLFSSAAPSAPSFTGAELTCV